MELSYGLFTESINLKSNEKSYGIGLGGKLQALIGIEGNVSINMNVINRNTTLLDEQKRTEFMNSIQRDSYDYSKSISNQIEMESKVID